MAEGKRCYFFSPEESDADQSYKNLLGGKGANLAEMCGKRQQPASCPPPPVTRNTRPPGLHADASRGHALLCYALGAAMRARPRPPGGRRRACLRVVRLGLVSARSPAPGVRPSLRAARLTANAGVPAVVAGARSACPYRPASPSRARRALSTRSECPRPLSLPRPPSPSPQSMPALSSPKFTCAPGTTTRTSSLG
jgi:hypothetical protein